MRRSWGVIAGALVAGSAFAARATGSVTDEAVVNSTQSSPSNPRSGSIGDSLNASFDLTKDWAVSFGALLTLEGTTPAADRGGFPTSATTVSLFSLGLDWEASDHWSFGGSLSFAPASTLTAGTEFTAPNTRGVNEEINALVYSESSEFSGLFDVNYDTAGDSNLEWSFGAGIDVTHLATNQNITEARFADEAEILTPAQLKAICARNGARCVKAVNTALQETPANLDSERFSVNATATVSHDTDLRLAVDYYNYDQDPATIGFFSLVETGRAGLGVPIAPLQFLVRPELTQRFGSWSLRFWVQAGEYEPGTGDSTAGIGARVQYKFTKSFRMWLTVSGQRDTDVDDNPTKSGGIALGAGYRW